MLWWPAVVEGGGGSVGCAVGCVWGRMPVGIEQAARVVALSVVAVGSLSVSMGSGSSCIVVCSIGMVAGCCVYRWVDG